MKTSKAISAKWTEERYESSAYKHVSKRFYNNGADPRWVFCIIRDGKSITKSFKTEREAAIAADKFLINEGKVPVNILKSKT